MSGWQERRQGGCSKEAIERDDSAGSRDRKKKLEKIQGTSVDAGSIVFVDELVVGFERRRNEGWLLEFGWNAGRILEPIPKVRNGRTQRFGRTRNRMFSLKH